MPAHCVRPALCFSPCSSAAVQFIALAGSTRAGEPSSDDEPLMPDPAETVVLESTGEAQVGWRHECTVSLSLSLSLVCCLSRQAKHRAAAGPP